jgi:hypothetical protein
MATGAPPVDSVENSTYFTCITNSASTSATVDLSTHAHSPGVNNGSAIRKTGALTRAIYIVDAGLGKLAVQRFDGTTVTITNLSDGQLLNIRAKKIMPTSRYSAIVVYW